MDKLLRSKNIFKEEICQIRQQIDLLLKKTCNTDNQSKANTLINGELKSAYDRYKEKVTEIQLEIDPSDEKQKEVSDHLWLESSEVRSTYTNCTGKYNAWLTKGTGGASRHKVNDSSMLESAKSSSNSQELNLQISTYQNLTMNLQNFRRSKVCTVI